MTAAMDAKLRRIQHLMLVIGLIGSVLIVLGAFIANRRQFFISYLFGFQFWLGLALGCVVITMIHHLTGGRWGFPVRRFMEAGIATVPLMAVLFIPLLFGLAALYPWARPEELLHSEVLRKRLPYMTPLWFSVRAVFYFAQWLLLAWLLRRWSLQQDQRSEPTPTNRLRTLSGPGLVILPLSGTFAFIDWIMSLEKAWYSSMFAVIVMIGQVLVAYAFVIVLLRLFSDAEPLHGVVTKSHFHELGNLLLAFVVFWTYVAFGQFLIIYSANTPHEIEWYLHRIAGGWKLVVAALALFHFFLPFFLLLFRFVKKRATYLSSIAALIFVIHIVNVYWLIMPSHYQEGLRVSWLDFIVPVAIGGLWMGVFLSRLRSAPLLPVNDPRLEEIRTHAG